MGAWGTGIFDNDDAADWVSDLEERGLAAVGEALQGAAARPSYLEAPDGAIALAAADVVARLNAGGGERSAYTESVDAWVDENAEPPGSPLVDRAMRAVERVRGPESELRELWEDAGGDDLNAWLLAIGDVEGRLR